MLINGDLIRVPQGTVVHGVSENTPPAQITATQKMGIVIDNESKALDLITILLDDQLYFVQKQMVQLVCGVKNVH